MKSLTLTCDSTTGKHSYGTNTSGARKKLVIDTIIGAFLENLYKARRLDVISLNYLGDWSTQFGMITTGFKKYGSQEELEKTQSSTSTTSTLKSQRR
ncbi:hypothetical protein BDR04DRAFT_1105529 [Suillus decipiens]|nr:hypothetical protein BDR04DRAFT_1105529 [Suillus decipiens]